MAANVGLNGIGQKLTHTCGIDNDWEAKRVIVSEHSECEVKVVSVPKCNDRNGSIQLITGPMFSGKTTELLRVMKRYELAKMKVATVKYEGDNRYSSTQISTHDGRTRDALTSSSQLDTVVEGLKEYDVIGIDEGQFFKDIVNICEELANSGCKVIVAALDGTFERKPFGHIHELMSRCEKVKKLSAICEYCHGDAAFTLRVTNEEAIEVIGGADKYRAVCRKCHSMSH